MPKAAKESQDPKVGTHLVRNSRFTRSLKQSNHFAGYQGIKGDKGYTGSAGLIGPFGANGDKGNKGVQGECHSQLSLSQTNETIQLLHSKLALSPSEDALSIGTLLFNLLIVQDIAIALHKLGLMGVYCI